MRITQKELARRLGISRELVAHALRDRPGVAAETRERVHTLARELGYRPNPIARQLRGGQSSLLGVLIGHDNPQVNFDRLAQLDREAYLHGYRLMVGHFHDDTDRAAAYLSDFADRGVEGVIWIDQPASSDGMPDIEELSRRVPHVIALHDPRFVAAHRVHVDYASGIRQAVRHLVARGKSRIALALASPGWEGNPMSERLRGYREELAAQGLTVEQELVWVGDELNAEPARHVGEVVSRLVEQGRADGILASNDFWGVETVKELHARGFSVPGDVAVVGFDNLNIAERFAPALTTIDQQHQAFAQAVMSIVRDVAPPASGATATHHLVIEPRLVVRETS